jgi:hypothetical protein
MLWKVLFASINDKMIIEPNSLGFDMENESVRENLPTLLHDCIRSLQVNGSDQEFIRVFHDLPNPEWIFCLHGVEILQKVKIFDSLLNESSQILCRLLQEALEQQSIHAKRLLEICLRDSGLRKSFLIEYSQENINRPVVLNLVVGLLDQLCQNRVSLNENVPYYWTRFVAV